jgi:DNA-binding PadR family transcriptional regulator
LGRPPIPQALVGFMIRSILAREPSTVRDIREGIMSLYEMLGVKYSVPKTTTIQKYIAYLKSLGLVEKVGTEPSPYGYSYAVYSLTPLGRRLPATDVKWMNPQAEYYRMKGLVWVNPETGERIPKNVLGRRRYARRVLKIPPRPPGRPRKQFM